MIVVKHFRSTGEWVVVHQSEPIREVANEVPVDIAPTRTGQAA